VTEPETTAPLSPEAEAAFEEVLEARAMVEADWARAEAAGGLPYPRGRAWATKDLPENAVLVDQAGRRYERLASGELRRLKGTPPGGGER